MQLQEQEMRLLQSSFVRILPQREKFVQTFYNYLFTAHPEVRPLFAETDMRLQQTKLLATLTMIVNNIRSPQSVAPALKNLGHHHANYKVHPEHYAMVGEALLHALSVCLGSSWTPELSRIWTEAYRAIAKIMCPELEIEPSLP